MSGLSEQEREVGGLEAPCALEPAENLALTVAWHQVERGEEPAPNVAAVCVIALERIRRAALAARTEQARPWAGCTGASDCPESWHEHGCYADDGQCSDPKDHHGTEQARPEHVVKAGVWSQGYRSGFSDAIRRMSDEPNAPRTPNPWSADALEVQQP